MPRFGRKTIIAAVATLEAWGHSDIDRFMLEYGLEDTAGNRSFTMSRRDRTNALIAYLLKNPNDTTEESENLTDTIVRDLTARAIERAGGATSWNPDLFGEWFPELSRALKRDGFVVSDRELRGALPESLNLPEADDEVHVLLKKFQFTTALGHLDQAITNHADGHWAAANSQLRSAMESVLDDVAEKLAPDPSLLPPHGHARRVWLATGLGPPFLFPDLNEWDDKSRGTGFLEGFYRRLHPAGSHPGLSDEDDCTFRLHIVLLVARLLLRRLESRIGKTP